MDSLTLGGQDCSHQNNKIVSTKKTANGSVRHWRECLDCGHTWTNGGRSRSSKLTKEQVLEILQAPAGTNMAALGRRLGVHRDTIRQIRNGKLHSHLLPEIDRLDTGRTCGSCGFHSQESGCLMSFPEYVEIGTRFASECVTYVKNCDSPRALARSERHT